MKKFLIASGVATLAFAAVAMAQGYTFHTNLTIGSTGPDVVALQTWLITSGFPIPAITSGAASKGYFGSQTKAAVAAYQVAHSIVNPGTGFFGPLTQAVMNGGSTVSTVSSNCLAGWTSASYSGTMYCVPPGSSLPAGNTLPANNPTNITTPGVAGSLDISNGSYVGNGTTVNDGQSVDITSFAMQSGASDMGVSSIAVDFNIRPWLYMNTLTLRDTTGKVLATVTGLSQSNFTEITVGSDYRITIPANFVIPKATRYLTVLNGTFGTSNRAQQNIDVTQVQVRSVDGTGVTLTSPYTPTSGTYLYANYNGQQSSSIVATLDSSSPYQNVIQTNSGNTQTPNTLLAVYDLKSQNVNSTLQGLTIYLNTVGNTPANVFANVQLMSGSTLLSSGSLGSAVASGTPVTFTNFNLALPSNVYTPVSIVATIQGGINGVTASTSLDVTAANITGIDSSSNPLTVNSSGSTIRSSIQALVLSGGALSNLSFSIAPALSGGSSNGILKTTTFSGSFTISGGNNPIYISRNVFVALGTTTNFMTGLGASSTITSFTPSNGLQSTDNNASFYTITPGSPRTFNFSGVLVNNTGVTQSISTGVNVVNLTDDTSNATKLPINFLLSGLNSDLHLVALMGTL